MERVLARQVATDLRKRLSIEEQDAVSGSDCFYTAQYWTQDPQGGEGRSDCPCVDCYA